MFSLGKTLFRAVLSVGSAVLLLAACEARREVDSREPLEEVHRLIDSGRPAEAAAMAERLARTDSRPEVRTAWASALAAEAGIKVDSYWGFVVGFKAPLLNMEQLESTSVLSKARKLLLQLDGRVDLERESELGRLTEALGHFELFRHRLTSIPVVAPEKRDRVDWALSVLNGNPKSGARLYRAILGFIILRTEIENGFAIWNEFESRLRQIDTDMPLSEKNLDILCALDVSVFARWMSDQISRVDEIARDVVVAYPSKRGELADVSEGARRAVGALSFATKAPGGCR